MSEPKVWSSYSDEQKERTLFDMYTLTRALAGSSVILRKNHPVTITDARIPLSATSEYVRKRIEHPDAPFPAILEKQTEKFMSFPPYLVHPDIKPAIVISIFSNPWNIASYQKPYFWCIVPRTYEWETFMLAFCQNSSFNGVLVVETSRSTFIRSLEEGFFVREVGGWTYLSTMDIDWETGDIFDEKIVGSKLMTRVGISYSKEKGRGVIKGKHDTLTFGNIASKSSDNENPVLKKYPELISTPGWRKIFTMFYTDRDPFVYEGTFAGEGRYLSFRHAYLAEKNALAGVKKNVFSVDSGMKESISVIMEADETKFKSRPFSGDQAEQWQEQESVISYNIWMAIAESDQMFRDLLLTTKDAELYERSPYGDTRLTELEQAREALVVEMEAQRPDVFVINHDVLDVAPGELEGEKASIEYPELPAEFRLILSHYHKAPFEFMGDVKKSPASHYKNLAEKTEKSWYLIYKHKLLAAGDSPDLTLFQDTLLATGSAILMYPDGERADFLEKLRAKMQATLEAEDANEEEDKIVEPVSEGEGSADGYVE